MLDKIRKIFPAAAALAISDQTIKVNADHGIVYSQMCDPYGASSFYEESIDLDRRVRHIRANSCPHHYSLCQESECAGNLTLAIHHEVDIELPLYPGIARDDYMRSLRCSAGSVAISLNGVGFQSLSQGLHICGTPEDYGVQNGIGSECALNGEIDGTRFCGDQVIAYASEFDYCGGHADRHSGVYHYHIPPSCLLEDLGARGASLSHPSANLHSVQIGWAMDGFPVYGPIGPNGVMMRPCTSVGASTPLCLDSCNGYYGRIPGVDEYMYRYYVTGPVGSGRCSSTTFLNGEEVPCDRVDAKCCVDILPSVDFAPYTLGCYRGCAYDDPHCLFSNELEGTSDYFFPSVSNYRSIYESRNAVEPSVADDVDPDPAEMPPDILVTEDGSTGTEMKSLRSIMQRVLTPHRGFSIASTNADGELQLVELGSDTRETTVIGSIALDNDSDRLYYTTQTVVARVEMDGSGAQENVISGITRVRVLGFNFGSSVADVLSITIRGEACLSVVFVSSREITCILTSKVSDAYVLPPTATKISTADGSFGMVQQEVPLQVSDVTVTCTTGRMTGIHEQPETVARGRSGRMVVASIEFTLVPHTPLAVAVSSNSVFWSDIGSAQCVYRALYEGTQVQQVLTGASSVYDLFLYQRNSEVSSEDCTDAMICSSVAAMADTSVFPHPAAHYDALFYVDASRALQGGMNNANDGVVGVIPVLREGSILNDAPTPVSATPRYHSAEDTFNGSCSLNNDASGTISRGGVRFRAIYDSLENRDILLVSGLHQPQSISVDEGSGYALVVTADGTLWRLHVFQALQYYLMLSAESDCCVKDVESGCSRVVVDLSCYGKRGGCALPDWLSVVFASPQTFSKFMGVSSIPSAAFDTVSSVSKLKNERRLFVTDANMNRVWLTDLMGSNYRYIELQRTMFGVSSKVLYPTDVAVRRNGNVVEVFVSEYLGKIWRLTVSLESLLQPDLKNSRPPPSSSSLSEAINFEASRSSVLDKIPLLLLDASNYYVSNVARLYSPPPFLGSDN